MIPLTGTNQHLSVMEKRTIVEIGKSLTANQRKMVVNKVATRGRMVAAAVYRYLAGTTKPLYLYQELICQVLEEELNTKLEISDLWPDE